MLKRFTWKENDVHSIQLKNDLFILIQLLKAPYIAVFNIKSYESNFENRTFDLNLIKPFGVCMVLKDFFRKCSVGKIKNIQPNLDIPLPEIFISKDKVQWGNKSQFNDDELIFNLVEINPFIGDQGIMGNRIVQYDIDKKDPKILTQYEITGYNTGYEFVRRLILSIDNNQWLDPLKELWLLGKDNYPLKTVEEMWASGVPQYF